MESSASLMDLNSAIKSLERSSDSIECWLMFWTAAVAVGLIIEYGPLIWRRIRGEKSDHGWEEIVGGILITLGVAGEFFMGAMRVRVETKLRVANHAVITFLNIERVGRQFTEEQEKEIVGSLEQFVGRAIFISSYSGDAEAARLGLQIRAVLIRAGLDVGNNLGRSIATEGGVTFGIGISGPESDKDLIDAVTKSLQTYGHVDATGHIVVPTMRIGNAVTGIMVALRPLPPA